MTIRITRLADVDYYLPLYDEDGDLDPEAHYHRNILALGRDFGLPGVSDWTAHEVMTTFPMIEHFTHATAEVQAALIAMGKAIEKLNPEEPATSDQIDAATINVHSLLATK